MRTKGEESRNREAFNSDGVEINEIKNTHLDNVKITPANETAPEDVENIPLDETADTY